MFEISRITVYDQVIVHNAGKFEVKQVLSERFPSESTWRVLGFFYHQTHVLLMLRQTLCVHR